MADPVTLAIVGATAGAALNPDDPLKGAVIGGTLGYGGASLAGLGAAGSTAAAGTTVGASGIGGAAGGTGLTATTTGSAVPGSALGAASAGQTGLTAMANPAMSAAAPLSTASAPGLAALANPSMSLAAPVGVSAATPTMISAGMPAPTIGQMDVAKQLMARGQPQQNQKSEVRQGGMMRPGQAVNVVEPVASLLEPLKNRRPRPAFSLL